MDKDISFDSISWDFDGMEIERESFARIDSETPQELRAKFTNSQWHVVRRLIHTVADFSISDIVEFSQIDPLLAGINALKEGANIYCDSNMIKSGLSVVKLQKFNPIYTRENIICPIAEEATIAYAKEHHITRALAGVHLYQEKLDNAIFLCGNAPLALASLIKLIYDGKVKPALIIGMPVGFVNVVESKRLLDLVDVPFVRLNGRRGGSPLAVATLHGMLEEYL